MGKTCRKRPQLVQGHVFVRISTNGSPCPVLDFFQEAGCHQSQYASGPRLCIGPAAAPKPCTKKPAPGSITTECPPSACPKACLIPAWHRHSAPACPWESCKVSCQMSQTPQTQTSRVPGPCAFYSLAGAKKAKAAFKHHPTPPRPDILPGLSGLCRIH